MNASSGVKPHSSTNSLDTSSQADCGAPSTLWAETPCVQNESAVSVMG
jgi:hypothetical protein